MSTLDGVVGLEDPRNSGSVISRRFPADRFLMALLRAAAGAVLLAAGTFRATPGHRWTAEHVLPDLAEEFGRLRTMLGLAAEPVLYLVSGSGDVETSHPALTNAVVLTSSGGAARLRRAVPRGCEVRDLGSTPLRAQLLVEQMRGDGHKSLLTEGGPTLFGQLAAESVLTDLYLTLAPRLAGSDEHGLRRHLVEGHDLLPAQNSRLMSVREAGGYLFLHHRFTDG